MSLNDNHLESNVTFFIHNHKCGGHSIRDALIETDTPFIWTYDIAIDQNSEFKQSILRGKSTERLLIFGHPDKIPPSIYDRETMLFLNSLYTCAKLIFPSRHPISLLVSWLEYIRTRLIDHFKEPTEANSKMIADFLRLWSVYSGDSEESSRAKDFSHPYDSAYKNIRRWIDASRDQRTVYHFNQSYNLFFPQRAALSEAINQGVRTPLPISRWVRSGKLFVYDSEQCSAIAMERLGSEVGELFAKRLARTRLNVSKKSLRPVSPDEWADLETYLATITDADLQIYRAAV